MARNDQKTTNKQDCKYRKGKQNEQRTRGDSAREVNHKFNDVSWYSKNPQMLNDAASFSYNAPLGSAFNAGTLWGDNINAELNVAQTVKFAEWTTAVPGLYELQTLIGPGLSTEYNSPVNLAAQNIYSYVRYMNSGAKNYDPEDLMMYLLAMDSLFSTWNWAKRLYGIAALYSQQNWYLPDLLLKANHVDPASMRTNLADFREFLNRTAARITSFCVPAVMPIFVRHSWMFSNVYKDGETEKAQLYMFTPKRFYYYDETSNPKGGMLVPDYPLSNPYASVEEVKGVLNKQLDALAKAEDIGIISGDILKAYGQDKLFKLTPVEPDYNVLPVYNEEVLNQIHNATILPVASWDTYNSTWYVTQDPDSQIIKWDPRFPADLLTRKGAIINMPWDNVTPSNTMVGTRLTVTTEFDPAAKNTRLTSCGTEVICSGYIWYYDYSTGQPEAKCENVTSVRMISRADTATWADAKDSIKKILGNTALLSNFDWHPIMYLFVGDQTDANHNDFTLVGIVGDIAKYTVLQQPDLARMNSTAVMSEFNIPQIGSF